MHCTQLGCSDTHSSEVYFKLSCVFILPFTAALVPGLADLFLMPLSATGSSSTSFSARELRLLGPLGFSTAALGGPDRKTTDKERKITQ